MKSADLLTSAHTESIQAILDKVESSPLGLDESVAQARQKTFGPNQLPEAVSPSIVSIFIRQFKSPLIYVLLLAGVISLAIEAFSDAAFIFVVLLINAGIGLFQEYRAEQSAQALKSLAAGHALVLRGGEVFDVDARILVPGDIVLVESGAKVPADLRLIDSHDLSVDESVLTGESAVAHKDATLSLTAETPLADRDNMLFAGSLVNTGRGRGVVTATGLNTELGKIATSVLGRVATKAPLIVRMEKFTHRITIVTGLVCVLLVGISVTQGASLTSMLLLAVALAVSAIPEGLPVALTVALSVGMERMAKRGVIVRRLVAVEALGSCTYIASDKTGTLTVNQLTVRQIQFPEQDQWGVSGEGLEPEGEIRATTSLDQASADLLVSNLAQTMTLPNEAVLSQRDGQWEGHGDSVDLALLVFAHKAGVSPTQCLNKCPEFAMIPYESERQFAASLNLVDGQLKVFVKGSLERLLPMCNTMRCADGEKDIDPQTITQQAFNLAARGYRVLAAANGLLDIEVNANASHELTTEQLQGLCFVGLVAMSDPPRPEAAMAVANCRAAGITVAMVTGDHPQTALAIAREVGFADKPNEVVTGTQLQEAVSAGQDQFDVLCRGARVFARVEPQQKLQIVESLQRQGHFVAVTGDGANDAPALRAAQVGVAMGMRGTDVAKETSDIVITDDNFSSIVAGIEQGRLAYANVRKVIFLLISTGAAEVILFALALMAGLPLPLLAVQLLWLNLVTNGIQDIALAFEPTEGNELRQPPRPPNQGVFDKVMLQRMLLSAIAMGTVAFGTYYWLLKAGWSVEGARNLVLLLMVMFENLHAFNSRSETQSVFTMNPLKNKLLLFSVIAAQLLHVGAIYTPGLNEVLGLQAINWQEWAAMLVIALSLVLVNEAYKVWRVSRTQSLP
ncbi:cation-translocating P-type ATPase [Orrella daihaiensis]|uniref:HAD-IC family P-type ATPase n=1 Tax=Orrella daihaiensis TaxID=2782176 RepID=A0ABY4AIM9_9BURK|nr:HAD-IC family P-type ATPase [Orrella daihaiensis]UOD50034.1 HAD-IC family P-type ATPase [Orrella daihaiensis]